MGFSLRYCFPRDSGIPAAVRQKDYRRLVTKQFTARRFGNNWHVVDIVTDDAELNGDLPAPGAGFVSADGIALTRIIRI